MIQATLRVWKKWLAAAFHAVPDPHPSSSMVPQQTQGQVAPPGAMPQ